MKNSIIVLTILLSVGCVFGQVEVENLSQQPLSRDTSDYFPFVDDSSGYKLFYAIEVYEKRKKKSDNLLVYSREGSFAKFPWKRKITKGRWYFLSFPDTIIVKDINYRQDLIISLNGGNIQTIQFKNYDGSTVGAIAAMSAGRVLLGAGGASLGAIAGPKLSWSYPSSLIRPRIYAKVVTRRESDSDRKLRMKVEQKLIKEKDRKSKKE